MLIDEIGGGSQTTMLSVWRTDPKIRYSNCVGDIGTHIEDTVSYITGLHPKSGQPWTIRDGLDQREYAGGVRKCVHGGTSSQVCAGHLNGLTVRIFGTKAIEWSRRTPIIGDTEGTAGADIPQRNRIYNRAWQN
ncbi:MAG: hypothetical protein ACLRMZ_00335 [Blautia marasmi]